MPTNNGHARAGRNVMSNLPVVNFVQKKFAARGPIFPAAKPAQISLPQLFEIGGTGHDSAAQVQTQAATLASEAITVASTIYK